MEIKDILDRLNEDLYKGVNKRAYREIFINPTQREIRDASMSNGHPKWDGYIRFLALFNKKELFVFPADMLHPDAMEIIDRKFTDNFIEGI